jgi:hypothetical protein
MESYRIGILIVVIIFMIYVYMNYYYDKDEKLRPGMVGREQFRPGMVDEFKERFRPGMSPGVERLDDHLHLDGETSKLNWQETLANGLNSNIQDRQGDFVKNVKRFGGSSVRNQEIEEMSRFASTTNFLGFKRPQYVKVNPTNPFQPEEDIELFKMFKRYLL